MRKPLLIALIALAVVVLIGLLIAASILLTVRRPWPKTDGALRVEGLQGEVTIIRDSMGIPHIYASTPHDLFFAQGYVHAQDRFWQMEFWRRVGAGRLSEVLGEATLEQDRFIRTVGWRRAAARDLAALSPESRAALESYAKGVNAYISSRRGRLGLEFTILGVNGVRYEPEPWTPLDTLTWGKVMAWDLGGNWSVELLRAQFIARFGKVALEELLPTYPEGHPIIAPHPLSEATLRALPDAAFDSYGLGRGEGIGSNNWVVSGARTATGKPILADDTHLGIQMPSIWYEIGLHCEPAGSKCPFNVVGFSFAGVPGVVIGHNDKIAWGVTNLGPDVQDLFIEKVNPENPNQYEYQGKWLDMEIIPEEVRIAGQDEPVIVNVRLTRHGPIINDAFGGPEEEWTFGWQPLALSWTAHQTSTLVQSVLLLDQAGDWAEFRKALSLWDIAAQNFVYADVKGNIGYQATGRIPVRASGDGSAPVPGWEGKHEWKSYIPFDELPYLFNPEEGYIVTANNAVVGPDFPHFIARDWDPGYRARRISELLKADSSITVTDTQAIQGDVFSTWAEDVLPHLLVLPVKETGRSAREERRLGEALEMLRMWDRRAGRDSAGAALFEAFRIHLLRLTFSDELGEPLLNRSMGHMTIRVAALLEEKQAPWFDNIHTPQVETQDEILLEALEAAIEELTEKQGRNMNKWRWGKLHTATFENQSLGRSGVGLIESIFNRGPVAVDGGWQTVNRTEYSLSDPYGVRMLTSQRQIVDLADFSRSVSVHTTGQSGHPYHRHYDDMIELWRDVKYHPMLWKRADVEANAEGTLILKPRGK